MSGKSVPLSKQIDIPPVWLLGALIVQVAIDRTLPILEIVPPALKPLGWVLIVAAVGLVAWSASMFRSNDTPIHPRRKPTTLITTGPFAFSRNPIYLAMAMVVAGAWLLHGSLGALVPLPLFVWIIQTRFIAGEEFHIEKNRGDEWRDYAAKVRRWI